jgi:putative endonuclease
VASPDAAGKKDKTRIDLGAFGERIAADHLASKGYKVFDRNFRVAEAEIDLIAECGDDVVFVEVRTRKGGDRGMAALSVNAPKARKLRRAVGWYIEAHPEYEERPLRIDVITVELAPDGKLQRIEHIEDAIRG